MAQYSFTLENYQSFPVIYMIKSPNPLIAEYVSANDQYSVYLITTIKTEDFSEYISTEVINYVDCLTIDNPKFKEGGVYYEPM